MRQQAKQWGVRDLALFLSDATGNVLVCKRVMG